MHNSTAVYNAVSAFFFGCPAEACFVDWDFKNPNTLANKRKEKIIEQKDEIKELRDFKKDAERYFRYHLKIVDNEKLTKPQCEWYFKYVEEIRRKYKG